MKPKHKTFALVGLLCSPFLWLVLHDTRPWAGRPTINIHGTTLDVGCMGTEKTAGGDRPFPIADTSYTLLRSVHFSHTYRRDMTTYNAPLGLYVTVTWNTYVVGSLKIENFYATYSSVNPRKITKEALGGHPASPVSPPRTSP